MNESKNVSIGFNVVMNGLFKYLVLFIGVTSFISLIALIVDLFYPIEVVLLGWIVSLLIAHKFQLQLASFAEESVPWKYLLFVILLALFFRAEPYYWIYGGQDQGVYASMSAFYQRGGEISFQDDVLPLLGGEKIKELYEENLLYDGYIPGVFFTEARSLNFQFYHLHPLWMAVFGEWFGDTSRFYALTFFSLLSILGLCLIVYELTHSKRAMLFAGLLIATNPLHAFFSKWPVTEVVSLAFTSLGLYLFIRAIQIAKNTQSQVAIGLAKWGAIIFSLYFFTRISGFIFIPFFISVFIIGMYLEKIGQVVLAKVWKCFSGYALLLYAVSVTYGLLFSTDYALNIYKITYESIFASSRILLLVFLLLVGTVLLIITFFIHNNSVAKVQKLAAQIVSIGNRMIFGIIVLGFVLGVVKFINYSSSVERFVENIFQLGPLLWLIFCSPFLVLGVLPKLKRYPQPFLLFVGGIFFLAPLLYTFYLKWLVGYNYYYSRYMISEAVPYAIIFLIVILFGIQERKLNRNIILTTSLMFFIGLSLPQLGIREGERNYKVLSQISDKLTDKDLLLFNYDGWSTAPITLMAPLKVYFGKHVFGFRENQLDEILDFLTYPTGNVYVLSARRLESEYLDEEVHQYVSYDKIVERGAVIPLRKVDSVYFEKLFFAKVSTDAINLSKERTIVDDLYIRYLKRGLGNNVNDGTEWMQRLKNKEISITELELALLNSHEYFQTNLVEKDEKEIITMIFEDVNQRLPTEIEMTEYLAIDSTNNNISTMARLMIEHRNTNNTQLISPN